MSPDNIMIDIETLSTRPHATILIIGAIKFSMNHPISNKFDEKNLDTFYKRITISSCKEKNLHIDEETKKWWEKQESSARFEALEHKDRISLEEALKDLSKWMKITPNIRIWGNGSDFDITILREAYIRCSLKIPWKFWMVRDVRTIMDMGKMFLNLEINLPSSRKHHALYDCHRQIVGIQQIIHYIKNNDTKKNKSNFSYNF